MAATTVGEEVLYSERHKPRANFLVAMAMAGGASVLLMLASLMAPFELWMLIVGAVLLVLIGGVTLAYRTLSFEVTRDEVRFGFPIWKKAIPRSALVSFEPYELSFPQYIGFGIRRGRDGMAWQTRNGSAVRLTVADAKRPLIISVDEPEKICGLLSAATG